MKITPSFLISSLALAVATAGGIGYAAGSLPAHSVGAKQLKNNAVTAKAIKADAVTGDKVSDGSLSGTDLAAASVTGAEVADGSLSGADLAPNSITGAQVDESSLSIPSKPGSIVLSGYDFEPRGSVVAYDTTGNGDITTTNDTNRGFIAPVHVPTGAIVTSVKVYVLDKSGDSVQAYDALMTPTAGLATYSTSVSTSAAGFSSSVQTLSLPVEPIGAGQEFGILVYLPNDATNYALYGAEVDYS